MEAINKRTAFHLERVHPGNYRPFGRETEGNQAGQSVLFQLVADFKLLHALVEKRMKVFWMLGTNSFEPSMTELAPGFHHFSII
jgi:hypothetical protein